ncbi:metallophosphatase [Leptospira kobayashii]|uniref:Metallophosphatase n=1 Tax=Leptospira kobayashii TaxID=1917830 RepID=A0ABN6KHB9_9LEPT|nr:CapA family protein [Leptospira kobayashii]BDA79316.1 metallophosphatase [Leptospira kobayashii]
MKIYFLLFFYLFCVFPSFLFSEDGPEQTEEAEPRVIAPIRDYYRFKTETGQGFRFPESTKLWFGGDVMFNWGVRDSIRKDDPSFAFRSFTGLLASMDYRVLNLETPILRKQPSADKLKSYVFYGTGEDLSILKELQIDGVTLGNNHTMDFGEPGLKDTLSLLAENKISSAGAGDNESLAMVPLLYKSIDNEFRIFSFSDTGETRLFAGPRNPGAAYFRVGVAERLARKTKPNQVNILAVHWGVEYNPEPTETQRKAAKYLIGAGYQAIIGHHPHIPQGIEVFPKGVVIYSLGNFFFGSKNQYLKHNISAVLHFQKGILAVVEVIPIFGRHQSMSGDHFFSPLGPKEADEFLKEYAFLCKNLGTELVISGGRGYVFLDKELKAKLNP